MARYMPGSQTQSVLQEKEAVVRALLDRGLTTTQIRVQVRCSADLVRRIRRDHEQRNIRDS